MSNQLTRLGLSLAAAVSCISVSAQGTQSGTISGVIRNQEGQPISGATVIIEAGRGQRTTQTSDKGTYRFSLLVPGQGKLKVSAPGYISVSSKVTINVDKINSIEFVLKPVQKAGAVVEVVAAATKVDPTETKSGTNLTLSEVGTLPINNRNIETIAYLTPGTSQDGNGMTIRGSQATQVQYLVDGADVQDPVTGGPSVMLNEELLEEVQVITGAVSAEYGRFTGGVVNTLTKSGTNQFAGSMRFDITNPRWNAHNPMEQEKFPDAHGVIQNYMVSGPLWKDHLFFLAGYRTTSPMTSIAHQTSSYDYGRIPFTTTQKEDRKDIKVDWQINQNHRLYYLWNKSESTRKNIDYPHMFGLKSTTLSSLSTQVDEFAYDTFGYAGSLSDNLMLEAKYNKKKEILGTSGSGGQGPKNAPIWTNSSTLEVFDNGLFSDDGDSRPIKNASLSLTWFVDAMGSHEFRTGYQWFQSQRKSANPQTPSNYWIWFDGAQPGTSALDWRNRILRADGGNTTWLEWWEPIFGAVTKNKTESYFVNDKWKLNRNVAFNIGLRFDKFISQDDLGRDNYTFNEVSPRLAIMWDPKGDASQGFMAAYNVYVGNVIQGATDAASPAGNPILRIYEYISGDALQADGSLNRAAFGADPIYVDDPFNNRTTRFDKKAKNPRTQEFSLEYKHNTGYGTQWSVNLTKRKFDRFLDDFQQVIDGVRYTTIKNDPNLKRDYLGLELQLTRKVDETFAYGGAFTWSRLKGNIEGGQSGIYDEKNNFGVESTIPADHLSPYGRLEADMPYKLNLWGNYTEKIGKGKLNLSAMYYYTSGEPYSKTGANAPTNAPEEYAKTYTKFFGARGAYRFPATSHTDLQIGYSYPVWNAVELYGRLNITNIFNHQIQSGWDTTASAATGNWVPDPNYGKAGSSNDYIDARRFNLACGLRF